MKSQSLNSNYWCQKCRMPIKNTSHFHCEKCDASSDSIKVSDITPHWMNSPTYSEYLYCCLSCQHTWKEIKKD